MNRKTILILLVLVLVGVGAAGWLLWHRHDEKAGLSQAESETYYCPMHPTVVSDKPSSCPICGMKLVKRVTPTATSTAGTSVSSLTLSPKQQVLANVRTVTVQAAAAPSEIVMTARVVIDERRVAQVSSYTAGRVERLFADFTGDHVARGSAVATIYSPELFAAQREYIVALRNASNEEFSRQLAESARRRLLLLGMPASQIEQVGRTGTAIQNTTIVSPVSGVVMRKLVVPQQYVSAGQPLVEVADLSRVWVEADAFEQDAARVAVGQRAVVRTPTGDLAGTVTFIQPVVSAETRTVRVRIELPNPGMTLRPDAYVSVALMIAPGQPKLMLPVTSVVDRGDRKLVWVRTSNGTFSPREVVTGATTGTEVEIVRGLSGGEAVAAEGAFLIDSEAQLQEITAGAGTQGGAGDTHDH